MSRFEIQSGPWSQLRHDAELIRRQVFIEEQNISEVEEWDDQDAVSLHFVIFEQNQPIATARLLQNDSIGRVAVLKTYRGAGIGKLLMQYIIDVAKQEGRTVLKLSAQAYATKFYENLGFQLQGEAYLDCGIPHIDMYQNLKNS